MGYFRFSETGGRPLKLHSARTWITRCRKRSTAWGRRTSAATAQRRASAAPSSRYTRLSNGFSRTTENHAAAVGLNNFAYNLIKIHPTLRVTPAMAAGVTNRLWDVSDLVALLVADESKRPPKPMLELGRMRPFDTQRTAIGSLVAVAIVLASVVNLSAAAPRIILVSGPLLERPVLIQDWADNMRIMAGVNNQTVAASETPADRPVPRIRAVLGNGMGAVRQ